MADGDEASRSGAVSASGRAEPRHGGGTAADRLVAVAQRRLAVATLALLVGLVGAVGVTTAVLAEQSLDDSVDRTLRAATAAELERVETDAEAAPAASAAPVASAGAAADDNDEDDHAPAAADTFFLYLDNSGRVLANPEHIALPGLPDAAAATAARTTGADLRTEQVGGTSVRLLTLAVPAARDGPAGVTILQAGFILTLHNVESTTLLWSILLVGIGGLVGAAVVTFVVTRRALVPVRSAFERERRFVAAASHELRTPIALIRGSAEVLEREGAVREHGRRLVSDIVDESDRLGGLVTELADLAVAQTRPPDAAARCELGATVADVVRRARPMAEASGVHLAATESAEVNVRADRHRVAQVVLILIDNAVRHSPPAGQVAVTVAIHGAYAVVAVSDQGPGVPTGERERIFEPFARLESAQTGSGLGLAIAREIVESMGGQIAATSAPGGGGRFEVTLHLA